MHLLVFLSLSSAPLAQQGLVVMISFSMWIGGIGLVPTMYLLLARPQLLDGALCCGMVKRDLLSPLLCLVCVSVTFLCFCDSVFFLCTMCLIQVSIVSSCSFSVSVVSLVHSLGVSCVPCSWFGCVMPPVFDSGVCYGPCLWFRCRMSPVFGSGVCYVLCLWFRHLQCPLSLVQASVTSPIFGSGVCYVACLWFRLLFCPLYLF